MAIAACRTMASGLVGNNGSARWGVVDEEGVLERAHTEKMSESNRIIETTIIFLIGQTVGLPSLLAQ